MSIRTYIFVLLTSLVLLIAAILSYQSARIFLDSFESAIEETMYEISEQYPEQGRIEQQIMDYHVTTQWQKVPEPVRRYFPEIPEQRGRLQTVFVDWIYIAPPEKAYSLMVSEREGKLVFVSRYNENIHQEIEEDHHHDDYFIDPMVMIILVGLSTILIFVIVLLSIFKKVAQPMESLQQWAKQLELSDLDKAVPDFEFKELNGLAALIHDNMNSVAQSIEREQAFLRYASHELRTPIAVLRSNTALLNKINPTPTDKERTVRDRIERASLTMKSMTETLLWLSREGELDMPVEQANLGELVETTQSELQYLLAGKSVEVSINTDSSQVSLAVTPTVIVLNNLIRNAFQHTQIGHVIIDQHNDEVTITNYETDESQGKSSDDELGFGLGMQLVEKLTQQFGWQYHINREGEGYEVKISFDCKKDS